MVQHDARLLALGAPNTEAALDRLRHESFDLVLLNLPPADYDELRLLRQVR